MYSDMVSFSNLVPRVSYLFDIGIAVDIKKVRCPGNEVVVLGLKVEKQFRNS